MTFLPEKVVRLTNFGAFVELVPGRDGLIRNGDLGDLEEDLTEGQEITVMIHEIDAQGRVNLSAAGPLRGTIPPRRAAPGRNPGPKPRDSTAAVLPAEARGREAGLTGSAAIVAARIAGPAPEVSGPPAADPVQGLAPAQGPGPGPTGASMAATAGAAGARSSVPPSDEEFPFTLELHSSPHPLERGVRTTVTAGFVPLTVRAIIDE